jgi:hypothetical protein
MVTQAIAGASGSASGSASSDASGGARAGAGATTRPRLAAYWIATAILAFVLGGGGVADLVRQPDTVAGMVHLGYPVYFVTILGAWKLLGAITVVAPRLPRLKEWAYAGAVFDLTGALMSHAACGDGVGHLVTPAAFTAVAIASWVLRPASRRLAA